MPDSSEHWWLDALCRDVGLPEDSPKKSPRVSRWDHKIAGERPRRLLDTGPGCGRTRMRGSTMTDVSAERWLPVVGYEGSYEVSSQGRVRSLDRVVAYRDGRKPKMFKGCERKTSLVRGYPHLILGVRGQKRNALVHALICEAFYGPRPSPDHEVRHLNGDPLDNRVENLAWGTKAENAQDSIRHGTNNAINKTECLRGHRYTASNTGLNGASGGRYCRTCARAAGRRYYATTRVEKSRHTRERLEKRAAQEGRTLRKRNRTALTESAPPPVDGPA